MRKEKILLSYGKFGSELRFKKGLSTTSFCFVPMEEWIIVRPLKEE
jgi:hypothetical protein